MEAALLKRSHEDLWLQEGYLLAAQFQQGWICFRILGWEPSNVKPYVLAATLATVSNLAAWNEIADAAARRLTEPPEEEYIHHFFYGVNQPKGRIFFQYPSRRDRNSLVAIERAITGDVGYVDGDTSPFDGPFSRKSEFMTFHDLWPAFQAYNPLADPMTLIMLNFDAMRYEYQILTQRDEVRAILLGERRRRLYTVAGIDPSPASAPDWLQKEAGRELMEWTKEVMEGRA